MNDKIKLLTQVTWVGMISMMILLTLSPGVAQVTVFSDDFNTDNSATWTTSGTLGSSAWTIYRSGDDWGGRRNTSPLQLEFTNDVSATANVLGYVFASVPTSSFGAPYQTTLNAGGMVTWAFNMRQIRPDPAGFDLTSYGVALILAGETASTNTTGSGYAIVLGQPGSTDPIRLARYTTGLAGNSDITDIIASNTTGLADFGTEHLSIIVTYKPCLGGLWELFVRNDGTSFADPLSGTLVSQGTATDNTYTGNVLGMMAAYWQGSTAGGQTAFFDNVSVSVTEEPSISLGTNPTVCQGATSGQIAYSLDGEADTYSIDYSAAANLEGFVDVVDAPLTGNPITLVIPGGAALGDYSASLTLSSGMSGCVSTTAMFEVHVIDCSAPFIRWVPLAEGLDTFNCVSMTDCDPATGNIICYGLEYTPSFTGTVTSYTTGFLVSCSSLGDPITLNQSCVMTGGSGEFEDCANEGSVLFNSSGNTGSFMITAGVPQIIHQLCLQIPSGETLDITEFFAGSTSIDLAGGGFDSEELGYSPVTASWDQECLTLPVRWLDFRVRREDEFVASLEWSTTEEINNSHFDIQRSNDLGRTFTTIGKVMASDNDHVIHQYTFRDADARVGINYYRIRQVDFDGRFDFSEIRSLTFSTSRLMVNAWPNPVSTMLEIRVHSGMGTGRIGLYDITGRHVWSRSYTEGDIYDTIDVSDREAGVYTLVVEDGGERVVQKIILSPF